MNGPTWNTKHLAGRLLLRHDSHPASGAQSTPYNFVSHSATFHVSLASLAVQVG